MTKLNAKDKNNQGMLENTSNQDITAYFGAG
jgi:hypothetical protein